MSNAGPHNPAAKGKKGNLKLDLSKLASILSYVWKINRFIPLILLVILVWVFLDNTAISRVYSWFVGPSGAIYVSSPSVYTRERLVNDRNDQDYWLRQQLELLDKATIGFSGVTTDKGGVYNNKDESAAGGHAPARPDPAAPTPPPADLGVPQPASPIPGNTPPTYPQTQGQNAGAGASAPASGNNADEETRQQANLNFIDAFAVRSYARDFLRQGILENLLDDRHDLTGNSVYGLRFDTSVFPGTSSLGRAFVRISITAGNEGLTSRDERVDNDFADLPSHVLSYYASSINKISYDTADPSYYRYKLYKQWMDNVKWRLNSQILQEAEQQCQSSGSAKIDWKKQAILSINTVLALSSAEIQENGAFTPSLITGGTQVVLLPKPWSYFLNVDVKMPTSTDCSEIPIFGVEAVTDTIFVLKNSSMTPELNARFSPIDTVGEEYFAFTYSPANLYSSKYRNAARISLYLLQNQIKNPAGGYNAPGALIDACRIAGNKSAGCGAFYFQVPSGYFNFVERVIRPDMYAYSLFPRSQVVAIFNDRGRAGNVAIPGTGLGSDEELRLELQREDQHAGVEASLVGFADSRFSDSVQFGWVIDATHSSNALQKSQFALISVPAWTSGLDVTVNTGWLDSSSREVSVGEPAKYRVPIPPDYEAFDGFIGGQQSTRRPKISTELMDNKRAIELMACRDVSVVIPGLRLWRSAVVTIGSQRATRITVLPNMRGIIADFRNLPIPSNDAAQSLTVWTSEGFDSVRDAVIVKAPKDSAGCEDAPADQPPTQEPPPVE
ncbi:hypothetical protein [Mesorhizobium sp. M0030]|uniref:hypothetical protein n=1 Tax=Mesorhizobium sp. M0030 TaxID=2956851 RepID=UPI00333A0789